MSILQLSLYTGQICKKIKRKRKRERKGEREGGGERESKGERERNNDTQKKRDNEHDMGLSLSYNCKYTEVRYICKKRRETLLQQVV